ncbi:terminase small subunit [Arthrobacter phage Bridgette]|uniref:Terminase small subunit n=1 Tax=Arthrobacter phage Bridgette TaxID=2419949 RepID=A0A3G2KE40_9CAUD|nr:terminase small subunit [Arthrobacter phage Bridgette]AYN57268.1 terminase small subunit [Arthrobacter phage Bridgette]
MPGPAARPALQVVREGNPGKRPVPEQVAVPPADFDEPKWVDEFPAGQVGRKPVKPKVTDAGTFEDFQKLLATYEWDLDRWERKKSAVDASKFCRKRAAEEWGRVVPVLKHSVGLGNTDYFTVVDLCICIARLEWCERQISKEGLIVEGQRGPCRNPLTTVAAAYRTQFKTYIRELGLSPSARTGVPSRKDDDEDDPFD